MRDLKTFQEKVEAYRRNAPTLHTQKDLAAAIPLDKDELSKRLNAYKHPYRAISPLTCAQVQAIVRVLARWGAIETQEQAKDLLDLMECPHPGDADWQTYPLKNLKALSTPAYSLDPQKSNGDRRKGEMLNGLRVMLSDHSRFLRDRLASFVGRETELQEIRRRIRALLPSGGYLTITGHAGEGKSSIIAALVEAHGPEKAPFHFIPVNPGPEYQVNILRDLMARLIIRHNLYDFYVASESRPVLRDYFSKLLVELGNRGRQEVIFIDGIDQLKEEVGGERDLSFLPYHLPPGVVIVLGTRPDDTLRDLKLHTFQDEYHLPNLSRQDFDLMLKRRGVRIGKRIADRFYHAMQGSALHLDLVAEELSQRDLVDPEQLIQRVVNNPANIFSLSIDRLRRRESQWDKVVYPVLGLLLPTRYATRSCNED